MKNRALVPADHSHETPTERSGKAEFAPDVMRRFAALAQEMKRRHGKDGAELSDGELGKLIGWSEFGLSRLRKHNRGLTAAPALGLTLLAQIDYESFVTQGVRIARGPGFDVRQMPSFRASRAAAERSMLHAPAIIEIAADMLSVARPRSVSLAMLDHACSLVGLVNAAQPELKGTALDFATEHENDRVTSAHAASRRGEHATDSDDGGGFGGMRRLGDPTGAQRRNKQ